MKKAIIRHIILLVLLILGIAFLASCKSKIRYVPVENTKIEYRDRLIKDTSSNTEIRNVKDSVVIKDSIVYILNDKGDVIRKEVYQWKDRHHYSEYLLKQLQARYDSLLSVKEKEVQVPYPVKGEIEYTNNLKWYQEACIWFTSLVLVTLALYLGIKYRGKIFSLFRKLIFKV